MLHQVVDIYFYNLLLIRNKLKVVPFHQIITVVYKV